MDIPDDELWAARSAPFVLFNFIRSGRAIAGPKGVAASRVVAADDARPQHADHRLRAAFRRLQAPELIFSDPARLARILNAPNRPVQLCSPAKAHPADDVGKHHLHASTAGRSILSSAAASRSWRGTTFHVAHFLVQAAMSG